MKQQRHGFVGNCSPRKERSFNRLSGKPCSRWSGGARTSYGSLAATIGQPSAARVVASAVAANPIALWIPCHRVIRGDGQLGGFRWGRALKAALLEMEACEAGWLASFRKDSIT
ncbi:MAG: methylated-DNA--[protein]-cysteine S-methyltransferase [Verrucomicrobia bacterium]|nr:methylated-DNA--[protein]-cysteine S-methyltransferase [Verrucomicrobiota bacterium]